MNKDLEELSRELMLDRRAACPDLDALMAGPNRSVRAEIDHMKECETCRAFNAAINMIHKLDTADQLEKMRRRIAAKAGEAT